MPITVNNAELEGRIEALGKSSPVPVSKRAVVHSVLGAAVDAAYRRRISIGEVIAELNSKGSRRAKKRTTKRRQSAPPKTLKLTQPPAE